LKIVLLVLLPFCAMPITAQTLNLFNDSNSGLNDPDYGADFVVNDRSALVILGSDPNAPVTVTEYLNGNLIADNAYMGQTTNIGNFTMYGTQTAANIGVHTQDWFVNGNEVGGELLFEVIPRPGTLTVDAFTVASPNCSYPQNVGLLADVKYNILGIETGTNLVTSVPLVPYEDGEAYGDNGVDLGPYHSDIGPKPGYSDSNEYAADDGTFHDVPLGGCYGYPFGNGAGATQTISIYIGSNNYIVRGYQRWQFSGSSQGHGSVTNDSDVSIAQ
jgi:hypothetical protein